MSSYGLTNPPPTCNSSNSLVNLSTARPSNISSYACTGSNIAKVAGPMLYLCCRGSPLVLSDDKCQVWCDVNTDGFFYSANETASDISLEFFQCLAGAMGTDRSDGSWNATCISPVQNERKTGNAGRLTAAMGLVGAVIGFWGLVGF